ncbi:hypothetical protein B0H19DRAFT_1110925 [Mycena capillaripes]|nr:hypothetical protein B0H19DRAFT_1110925 [Mycena capillaripes]
MRGEQVRPTNVFDTLEFPRLMANPAVTGVYQINIHIGFEEQPFQIYPAVTPASVETLFQTEVATACSIFGRGALWQHQRPGMSTTNTGTATRSGYYYGGQASTTNPGAFTYSTVPDPSTQRASQSEMGDWISAHPTFDAQFPTLSAFTPTSINYGTGWLPYATACPFGDAFDKFSNVRIRALPAGDSITFGFQSSDGNGYRLDLEQMIVSPPWMGDLQSRQSADNVVDFIGSIDSGTMPDPQNEGHSGAEIAAIGGFLQPDLSQNPNVIFLLAGTNDINNDDDIDNAPARLMAVVDSITSTLPNAALLVGTIPLNGDATKEGWSETFNDNIIQMLLRRASDGARVIPVLMEELGPDDMADSLHPNDQGYAKMADAWFSGLWQAAEWGWIDPPVGDLPTGNGNKEFCSTNPVWYPQGPTDCTCSFTEPNQATHDFPLPPSGQCTDLNDNSTAVRFADLNGDGRAEYLWLDGQGATTAFLNLGSSQTGTNAGQVQWLPSGVIATGVGASRRQVQFADLNGDGRAEYLFVHDDGSVDAWLNLGGPDDGPNAAKVVWSPSGSIATGIGEDGAGVRFADLNGDGRAEYLWLDENGAMTAYLNLGAPTGGSGAANVEWLPQGVVATGPANGATRDNVILADINGDGRADYLTVTHTGGVVELWINGGGPDDGSNAAKVVWFPQGVIATGVGSSGVNVQFADLNGDGRAEYIDVNYLTSAVNAWLNGCPAS